MNHKTKNRLILLEGLPGTGKSTDSFRLYEQLICNGKKAHWIHEVSQPHSTLFFTESCLTKEEYQNYTKKYPQIAKLFDEAAEIRKTTVGIDQETVSRKWQGTCNTDPKEEAWYQELLRYDAFPGSLDRYEGQALEKWEAFTEKVLRDEDTVYIMDSGIFQYQIFTYLLKDAPYERLETFVRKIAECIKPLDPILFYLYREHTEDSIEYLKQQRGVEDLISTWQRDQEEPYYQNKQKDVTAFYDFLKDYAKYAEALFENLTIDKRKIEISGNDWRSYEDLMLKELQITRIDEPDCKATDETYINAEHGFSFVIKENEMIDPEGVKRRLSPKSQEEFFVEGIPTILHFYGRHSIRILGQQIIPQWTETGLLYSLQESTNHETIKKQYSTDDKLNIRISLHSKYSVNKQGFGNWIFSHYQISEGMSVLELGCGNGDMWLGKDGIIRRCSRLVLSDLSEGMLESAKEKLKDHDGIEYRVIDIQDIPFPDKSFDVVIANMMLYHVADLSRGLEEVRRVLKDDGTFYCATYGENGMMEYIELLFDEFPISSAYNYNFTLQNGEGKLLRYFSEIQKLHYEDALAVTDVEDMIDYIYSLPGFSDLQDLPRDILRSVLEKNMHDGILRVPKDYGMFIVRKT